MNTVSCAVCKTSIPEANAIPCVVGCQVKNSLYCSSKCQSDGWATHAKSGLCRAVFLPVGASAANKRGEGLLFIDAHGPHQETGEVNHIIYRSSSDPSKLHHKVIKIQDHDEMLPVGLKRAWWKQKGKKFKKTGKAFFGKGEGHLLKNFSAKGRGAGDEKNIAKDEFKYTITISEEKKKIQYMKLDGKFSKKGIEEDYNEKTVYTSDTIGDYGKNRALNRRMKEYKTLHDKMVLYPPITRDDYWKDIFYAEQYVSAYDNERAEVQKIVISLDIDDIQVGSMTMTMPDLAWSRKLRVLRSIGRLMNKEIRDELKLKKETLEKNQRNDLIPVWGYNTVRGKRWYVRMFLEASPENEFVYVRDIELIVPVVDINTALKTE